LAAGLRPDPLEELKRSPRPLDAMWGLLLRRGGEGRERIKGRGEEEGKGRGSQGRKWEPSHFFCSNLRPCA